MRTIISGIVALFAAFCMMDAAQAAPTIVSPADYSTVQTLTDSMKNLISPLNSDVSIFNSANTTARENYQTEYFYNNSVPATLSWSGTTGDCTVKVWRTNGGSESAPFFSETVSGTSTECYNLEVGCNYTWKVTDSQGNSAVGHFFTEDQAPRIIRGRRSNFIYSRGADCSNGRDIGGWATADGKRVKQGKIYRSGQLEYCSFKEGSETYQKMDMLYDVLGIRVDIDLRTVENVNYYADWKAEWETGSDNVCKWSGIGPDVERFTIEWETLGKGPSEGNPFVYDGKYGCQFPSYSALYSDSTISKKSGSTVLYSYTQTAAQNKIAFWAAFNRIYQAVVVDKEPVIFHCSHGKDRTGSLALVIHGLLGVSEANIKRDFATAWFCNPDYTFTQTSMNNMITGLKNLDTASTKTLAGGCEEYLISCATAAGDNEGATKVAAFKTAMLEDVEASDGDEVAPEPEEDTFDYQNYYWRRSAGGGTWPSSTGYWYKHPSIDSNNKYASGVYPDSYDACVYLMPTATNPYATPAATKYRLGKLIADANGVSGDDRLGTSSLQPYFSNDGHSVTDRSIIELRSGVCEFENMDIYLTVWGKTKYDSESSRTSVFNGTASVDIWANATLRVSDFISVSASKTYLKFPSDNCANARFEAFEHGDTSYPYNSIGWFTGGAAGTKQYIKVQGAYPLKFSASGKTSGVAGSLGLEFELGANNKTTTAAMLQVTGSLNINAGSTITVNAGGKGAGTYKLVSAGTLNDYANLDLRSNYTVTNCKSGYYGTIVKSGNNINLTIQEGTPPAEDEGLIDIESDGDWGYRLKIGNEVVLAFTNHTKSVNWQVPSKLENVQFLVVGGGGGGGEDSDDGNTHGGAGGGGGGVVTGLVDFAENSVVTITVGAGGNGGVRATQGGTNNKYGAAFSGEASSINVDGAEYVWAAGGGGDNGADVSTNSTKTKGNVGNDGGSSAGSRPGQTDRGAVVAPRVASVSDIKYADKSFGRQGGAGYYVTPADNSNTFYGYFSAAGGGGGATQAGGSAVDSKNAGNGGEGLLSSITGQAVVYGSGGGGATLNGTNGGKGGTGAGDGNTADVANGTASMDALPNQGGGGGGGARAIKTNSSGVGAGGAGGSGIVVLRYTTASVDPEEPVLTAVVAPTAVANLVYTGSELTGVVASDGYTLAGNTATDAGTYEATATLAQGYKWSDDTTEPKTISWSIAKATNEWTTEPKIEPATWTEGEAAGTLTPGVAKFGTVTSTMTELPTSAGNYTITYTVAEDKNYTGLTKDVSFTINAAAVDPDQPGGGDDTDDPVVTVPTINPEWGYVKTGLGAGGNEVAVVFTNHTETMTWTVPENLENVQFLVVGGGGGGGASTESGIGGGGGGGGCVVTGILKNISLESSVLIKVGNGTKGGTYTTGSTDRIGAAEVPSIAKNSSYFLINGTTNVIAYYGGREMGWRKENTKYTSGGYGGSNAGSRNTVDNPDYPNGRNAYVNSANMLCYKSLQSGGGVGYANGPAAAGGGGGATQKGFDSSNTDGDARHGGDGGKGLAFDITGTLVVYGSGGGGGTTRSCQKYWSDSTYVKESLPGKGGEGAGDGGSYGGSQYKETMNPGKNALANQGGGGGGGGSKADGGAGGSGIVVFRYTTTATTEPEEPVLTAVDVPAAVADLVYTGSELTGVVAADGYTLTDNTATDAGTYEATATLAEGYKWSDDTTEPKTISWSIAKATNEWTTEPSISLESWTQGETAGVLTAGVAKFGEVTSSMAEFPTAVGKYTITYTVVETDNYSGLTKEVSFEILKKAASYDFTVGDVALTDGKLTFKGNFAIDGESEVAKMNLVVSVYDVAEGGDALKTVTVEDISAGEFNQEIDIASLELADGVYYFAFEVQDEAGNVLVAAEERSMLIIGETQAVKPTVNYASGTKFTAIGVEQKPVVTPADGNGYTVSYEGDFTAAGTHRIVIALKDGWTWSDGTSDTLTYEYEFIERTYTKYYIKRTVSSGDETGTYQSDKRWYTDPGFKSSSRLSANPNTYDAHNIGNFPTDSKYTLFIDNEAGKDLTPKFGKFTINGNLRIRTYSGGLMFQNDTATPMPIWEVESGVSTIEGVVFDVNGSGTGYIDIGANTTNVLGGVNYNVNYDNGFESSKKLFVRFSDEATAGSALRVQDFEAYYATNFGWFEGGAEGSTYALDIEEGALNLNNPDAVSGVAGDLAITVKLGDKVGAEEAYLNVAGTLNINDGSTLTVDANSMPCGVYTIINAATFNGADLLTSAAGATVTGLAEFTSGELVREGNKIVLYIETTIPPRVPGIEGGSVATNAVFETARVAKPIWYKTKPAINGDEITFNRVTVKVPEYYDVTLETLADGYKVNLKLKDNLKAFIANKVENDQIVTPAIRIENEKVYIHLENTKSDLYYTLLKSTKLGAEADWQPTEEYAIGKADFDYTPAEGEAETCFFMAGDVMDEPPENENK